jgi:hypothetical protein
MQTRILESLEQVSRHQWNRLVRDNNPFLRHEFLSALERHGCVGERTGWLPHHLACFDESNCLVGATPLYLKTNSYGEFVFDWSWAQAYERYDLPYYPKFVSAVPYTPATGDRLLVAPDQDRQTIARHLAEQAREETLKLGCSSLHWLFPMAGEMDTLQNLGLMKRVGCQFHWHNPGYGDFDDFLDTLTAKKRKNIKRERRQVRELPVELLCLQGSEASDAQWRTFHYFYRSTFYRLGGIPTLSLSFFQEIATTMGDQILLVLARGNNRDIAGAISFQSDSVLYGRHWGCHENYDGLHFETCYYLGIEHCIRHRLITFEPGAQGEHKMSRGFLPTITYSAHWLANPVFSKAVAEFLNRETPAVYDYVDALTRHSPYRAQGCTL